MYRINRLLLTGARLIRTISGFCALGTHDKEKF